jgi:hypothetical protein
MVPIAAQRDRRIFICNPASKRVGSGNARLQPDRGQGVCCLRFDQRRINQGIIMSNKKLVALAAFATFGCISVSVAQERNYSEGPVVNMASIRTVDGKFDEYMQWVSTTWKKQEEAGKKAGFVVSYQVLTVEPRGPDDPDIILMVTYKNWAALDGQFDKGDAIAKELEGSVAAANKAQNERGKIRRVLGSQTMQVLNLK